MSPNQKDQPATDFPKSIGQPATRALVGAGYLRLEQLNGVHEKDILALHGVGPKAIRILKEALAVKGMSFVSK